MKAVHAPERCVSVVVPVHNRRTLIDDAVSSVLAQRLPDGWSLELIVVDDGSTDGTAEYLLARAEGDPRVRVRTIHHSGFPGAVRNRGVEWARGNFLAFLDSDDRWLPGKLARQIALHDETRCVWSHTRERWVRDGREVSQRRMKHRRRGDIFADALVKCIVGPSTVMMETSLFRDTGGFREDVEVAEDYEYWLRLLSNHPIEYVDEPLTEKRAGPWEQLSEKYGRIEGFRIAALRDLVARRLFVRPDSRERQRQAVEELRRKGAIYCAGARKRGRDDVAEKMEKDLKLILEEGEL